MNYKRALLLIVSFSSIALLLNIVFALSTDSACAQLDSLLNSKYDYSVTAKYPVEKDEYYQFNAGISFTLFDEANTSMNVDVVMQAVEAEYTDLISWNSKNLAASEVAVSRSAAREYGLSISDKIYSKHIVSGSVCEYSVVEILPEATCVRNSKTKNYNKGIIIMGYDDVYADNVSYINLIFTSTPIGELSTNVPENIIYRKDEISLNTRAMVPYLLVVTVLLIVLVCGQAVLLTKELKHNFQRLAVLGFGKRELDRSCRRLVGGPGIISIIISTLVFLVVHRIMNRCLAELAFVSIIVLFELIALISVVLILNNRLWRK